MAIGSRPRSDKYGRSSYHVPTQCALLRLLLLVTARIADHPCPDLRHQLSIPHNVRSVLHPGRSHHHAAPSKHRAGPRATDKSKPISTTGEQSKSRIKGPISQSWFKSKSKSKGPKVHRCRNVDTQNVESARAPRPGVQRGERRKSKAGQGAKQNHLTTTHHPVLVRLHSV